MKQKKNTKVVCKLFRPWAFEAKEDWLNAMALEGWTLKKIRWQIYWFERTEPDEYIIRMEMHYKDEDYIKLVEQTGAELIDSGGLGTDWVYFRRKSELGEFTLLPNLDDKIAHLTKVGRGLLFCVVCDVITCLLNPIASPDSPALPVLDLLVAILFAYGYGRIAGKLDELKKERQLHE